MSGQSLQTSAESSDAVTRHHIGLMVGAMTGFTVNDTLVKVVSESMPSGQLIFIRGVMATALILAASHWLGGFGSWRRVTSGWVAWRAAVDAVATFLFLISLFHLPLATAISINMVTPLVIAAMAAVWLGERVRPLACGVTGISGARGAPPLFLSV